jgi:hypothetical protein
MTNNDIAILVASAIVLLACVVMVVWADIKDRKEHPGDDDSIR